MYNAVYAHNKCIHPGIQTYVSIQKHQFAKLGTLLWGGKEKGRPMRCPNEHWLNSHERENRLCTLTMSFKLLVHEGTHP